MNCESIKNKRRIIDMMATMHFRLSDQYKHWLTACNITEIVISVILCSVTFVDLTQIFGVNSVPHFPVVGITSVFLFAFTLIKQHFELGRKAEKHYLAGKKCVSLKNRLNAAIDSEMNNRTTDEDVSRILQAVQEELNELPQIPDAKFTKLKHYHLRKVAFSKYLDQHANQPMIVCRIGFLLSGKSGK